MAKVKLTQGLRGKITAEEVSLESGHTTVFLPQSQMSELQTK